MTLEQQIQEARQHAHREEGAVYAMLALAATIYEVGERIEAALKENNENMKSMSMDLEMIRRGRR
jgi:hypothetical protein